MIHQVLHQLFHLNKNLNQVLHHLFHLVRIVCLVKKRDLIPLNIKNNKYVSVIKEYIILNLIDDKIDIPSSIVNINNELRKYDYEIENNIGAGNFGTVYNAKKISANDKNYVIKIIIDSDSFNNEINGLIHLFKQCENNCINCPEFICFVNALQFNNLRFIIYKNAGISLDKYLSNNSNLSDNHKRDIGNQLMDAVIRLHSFNIFHGDIKADNITIFQNQDGSLKVKIIDFGTSSINNKIFNNFNVSNYDIVENNRLNIVKHKYLMEINVVKKLINDKLGIQIANFQMKYLKYKLKYLALKNKINY